MLKVKQLFTCQLSLILISMSVILTACDRSTPTQEPAKTSKTDATASQVTPVTATYKMAVDATFPPFAFKNDKGLPIGFDIDVINAVGEKQGFKVNPISRPWDGIFDTLDKGEYDIVGSGAAFTTERQQKYNLSTIFINAGVSIFYKQDPKYTQLSDFKTVRIGIPKGSWVSDYKQLFPNPQNLVEYESSFLLIKALVKGEIGAAVESTEVAQYYINNLTKDSPQTIASFEVLQNAQNTNTPQGNVFVMKKGNDVLTNKVNDGLAQIKADGTYDKIYQKWFGTLPKAALSTASAPSNAIASNVTAASQTAASKPSS